jgi:hypothetical protein
VVDLLRRVVDDFGNLLAVTGSRAEAVSAGRPTRFEQYAFRFERGTLSVLADGSDDSIQVFEDETLLDHVELLTDTAPWAGAVGHGVMFAWRLKNQSGYADGLQIEFGWGSEPPGGHLCVQLVCVASELTASIVRALDGQFNSSDGLLT